jgi:hypothetical protein
MSETSETTAAQLADQYLAVWSDVTFTIELRAPDGEVAWAARVFLVLGDDGRIEEDYQLTVKAIAA